MNSKNSETSTSTTVCFVISLLFCLAVTALTSSLQKSPTYDESIHLFAGYSYLKWGDFRVNPEHPPLAKMLAALPLTALDLKTTGVSREQRDLVQQNKDYGWVLANRFVYSDNDAATLFFPAKLVMMILSLALGLCIFFWCRELYGWQAAVAALFVYCFDPNIIAHASIVQTDIPFALFFFASSYFFWRSLNELSWFNLLMTSLSFACATITKFSFVAILPIWVVLGAIRILTAEPLRSRISSPPEVSGPAQKSALVLTVFLFAAFAGYLAIWTVYRFGFDASPFQHGQLPGVNLSVKSPWLAPMVRWSRDYLFFPEAWIFGVSAAYYTMERTAYLLGEISNTGFWAYFPVAFLVKTPIPTLLFLIAGGALASRGGAGRGGWLFLLIPAVLFFSTAVWSHMNVGLRHILPVYPFLFVWIGGTVGTLWRRGKLAWKVGLMCAAAWLLGSSVLTYPNYLAFFNETVLDQKKAYEILVDSNLDWGQDLKGLKQWMQDQGVEKIQFAYFGTAEPSYYGIDANYLPGTVLPSSPPISELSMNPPYVAISATHLVGLYLENRDLYAKFRGQKPVAVIGNSIWIYKLTE